MARVREWSTVRFNPSTAGEAGTFDLLDGSGLDVDGATVQRCIGRIDLEQTRSGGDGWPRGEVGLLAGTEPDASTIFTDSSVEWLFYRSFVLGPIGAGPGDRVATDPSNRVTSWDVAGQRLLGTGDSLWLVYGSGFVDETEPLFVHVYNRALVLGPDE